MSKVDDAKEKAVEVLKARWIAKRATFSSRTGSAIFYDCDHWARREYRAYRLALVWARDKSLPGEWWWVQRDQRWDVYPQKEPNRLMRIVRVGGFVEFFYPEGGDCRFSYILVRKAA